MRISLVTSVMDIPRNTNQLNINKMNREIKIKAQKIHNNEAVYFDLKHFL